MFYLLSSSAALKISSSIPKIIADSARFGGGGPRALLRDSSGTPRIDAALERSGFLFGGSFLTSIFDCRGTWLADAGITK